MKGKLFIYFIALILASLISFPNYSHAATIPYLEITFPPSVIEVPKQISFAGSDPCDISLSTCGEASLEYESIGNDTPANKYDDYSVLKVFGFKKLTAANNVINTINKISEFSLRSYQAKAYSPPPAGNIFLFVKPPKGYEFKITFKPPTGNPNSIVIPDTVVDSYLTNLSKVGSSNLLRGYPGNDNCELNSVSDFTSLCLKTEFNYHYATDKLITSNLIQSLNLAAAGIKFQGNTASPSGTSSNYGFSSPKAVALGGSISGITGENLKILDGYTGESTKIDWDVIRPKLTELFNKRTIGSEIDQDFNSSNFYLNSRSNPNSNDISAFSTPPEGKLWYKEGDYTISRNGVGTVKFIGSGTIVVNGDLIIKNSIECESNTRLGFIVSKSIRFEENAKAAGCGVYTALGIGDSGQITFNNAIASSTWKAIFVAKGNITLPPVSGTLRINYYTEFADNPTVLFKDLLSIVFDSQ